MRRATATDEVQGAGDLNVLLHFFFHADLMADVNLVRRDVDFLSVNQDMTVTDELPSLGVGTGETQPDKHIVQTRFELGQQVLTRNTLLPNGTLKVSAELIFENAVNAF